MEKINSLMSSSYYLWKSFKEPPLPKPKKKPERKQTKERETSGSASQGLEYDAEGQRVDLGRLRKESRHLE